MPASDAAADLALLRAAAKEASEIALRHFGASARSWEKPDGRGPVTEADLEIDRMLQARLGAARPGYGWLSEESADSPARGEAERVFVVDPIDGTRAFAAGDDCWAHALALIERGEVIAGVVYLPKLGRLYEAAAGQGAHCNGNRLETAARTGLDGASFLANSSQFRANFWPGGAPDVKRTFRPSLAYRLCLVADGGFDATLTFRDAWEWDIAAGVLIAAEAGAVATDAAGRRMRFNTPRARHNGLILANPRLHAAILRRAIPRSGPS